jgi:hypothetical protein
MLRVGALELKVFCKLHRNGACIIAGALSY